MNTITRRQFLTSTALSAAALAVPGCTTTKPTSRVLGANDTIRAAIVGFGGALPAMVGALLLAVVVIPLWAYAPTTPLLVLGAFLMQFMVQGAWGVVPAHITELSPDAVRGFLPGFSYQCGVLLAGSVAYLETVFARHTSFANAMALTAFTVFTLGAVVVALGRENRGATFGR